jgi:hypothetical protein
MMTSLLANTNAGRCGGNKIDNVVGDQPVMDNDICGLDRP